MLITEETKRQFWCPHVRDEDNGGNVVAFCIASNCSQFRQLPPAAVLHRENAGYCGLSGPLFGVGDI